MIRAALSTFVTLLAFAQTVPQQPRESASCQSDIVSSTVVSTFCGHRQGDNEIVDLLVLWRGKPGWFQRNGTGRSGGAGSRSFGAGTSGVVSHSQYYGEVTIAFRADFDIGSATIGQSTIKLDHLNTIVVDDVDSVWRITNTRLTDPTLPIVGDWNLVLAKRSREFVRDLQCDIPMPAAPPLAHVAVVTVCDKLKKR
jgi:hypothetical protein